MLEISPFFLIFPWVLQDGTSLKSYGIVDGSLIHPLYGWRDGSAGSDAVARLLRAVPWQESEWYTAAMTTSTQAVAAAASLMQAQLGSLGATLPIGNGALRCETPSSTASHPARSWAADAQNEL